MDSYDWSISRQGTERFLQFRATDRRLFLEHFDQLVANVHLDPTTNFTTPDGFKFSISTIGKHIITYHVDHAVKMLYIVAIE